MIQTAARFDDFNNRLNTSRLYHDRLAGKYSRDDLFDKYCSFVSSLPNPEYSARTFNMFVATVVDFEES